MTLMRDPPTGKDPDTSGDAAGDYERLQRAILFIADAPSRPDLAAVAAAAHLSTDEWRQLLVRFAALTPQALMDAVAPAHARRLLEGSATLFHQTASAPADALDFFIRLRLIARRDFSRRRADQSLRYGFHACPFGIAVVIACEDHLCGLAFADFGQEQAALTDMKRCWPAATYHADQEATAPLARRVFDPATWRADQPLPLVLVGTEFELQVWQALLRVPFGRAVSYSDLACAINKPTASRAVGAAVGRNPISFVVPCHRVLGKSGTLTGYHWGLARKQAMLAWEAGRLAAASNQPGAVGASRGPLRIAKPAHPGKWPM